MDVVDRLHQMLDGEEQRLRAALPTDRTAAILAIVGSKDRVPLELGVRPERDVIAGNRVREPGHNFALRLVLESDTGDESHPATGAQLATWADDFVRECGRLAEARLVLAQVEADAMRISKRDEGRLDVWVSTRRGPASWRERIDFDWWAARLAAGSATLHQDLSARQSSDVALTEADARTLTDVFLATMANQPGYPLDVEIEGNPFRHYRDVLRELIVLVLRSDARTEPIERDRDSVVEGVAAALGLDPATVDGITGGFTLSRDNAAWHAAVPGIAAAPLIETGPDRIVLSRAGLTTEPLLFLTRELRRREAEAYHNASHHREDMFRRELYALFPDRRFVTSAARLKLRRDGGDVRTDVDAAIFDRKTGTLAVFELKSQDPFARSAAERTRQRDNVLYANRQVSGILAWVQKHGADELLGRFDARTAKTFRVNRVLPFVVGRYLAHFDDGPAPDARAAWGTWPQILRLLDEHLVVRDANPLNSLFSRLIRDAAPPSIPPDLPPREIALGELRITVYPSAASARAAANGVDR